MASDFADTQVRVALVVFIQFIILLQVMVMAEYATSRLIDFLRASNYYNLEKVCSYFINTGLLPITLPPGLSYLHGPRFGTRDGFSSRPYG